MLVDGQLVWKLARFFIFTPCPVQIVQLKTKVEYAKDPVAVVGFYGRRTGEAVD